MVYLVKITAFQWYGVRTYVTLIVSATYVILIVSATACSYFSVIYIVSTCFNRQICIQYSVDISVLTTDKEIKL